MPHPISQRHCCDGCGASAPETNTDYTLISRSFGWRLTRRTLPNGALAMEWRCASCWKKYKEGRVVMSSIIPPLPSSETGVRLSPKASPPSYVPRPISKRAGGVR
jgi:hypothetical protein